VKPQVFTLSRSPSTAHRLVLDLYPLVPLDPLAALIEESESRERSTGESPQGGAALRLSSSMPATAARTRVPPGRQTLARKDITLTIARRLKALVDRRAQHARAPYSDGDYYLPLHVRVDKARKVKADLFVSIHADAFIARMRAARRCVRAVRARAPRAASWLAKKENEADLVGGVNLDVKDVYLKKTLLDLAQTATSITACGWAICIAAARRSQQPPRPRVEQASFAVLKAPDGFDPVEDRVHLQSQEEKRLNDESYQNKLAAGPSRRHPRLRRQAPAAPSSPLALN